MPVDLPIGCNRVIVSVFVIARSDRCALALRLKPALRTREEDMKIVIKLDITAGRRDLISVAAEGNPTAHATENRIRRATIAPPRGAGSRRRGVIEWCHHSCLV